MKSKKGVILMALGGLLIAMAVGLTGYNLIDERRAAASADGVMEELDLIMAQPHEEIEGLIPDYQLAPEKEMPTAKVDDNNYAGYISIPSLDLRLPVLSDWSYPNLKIAPCRYSGTAYEDNFVICAHNYRSHFGRLKNLSTGDAVQFVDIDGNVFDYVAADMEQLKPEDTFDMITADWPLSLFTCTTDGQLRLTVRCDRAQ